MQVDVLLYTFLLSILPLGEAKTGIPYAMYNKVHYMLAFAVGLLGNVLIYPFFMWLIDSFNKKLMAYRWYKKLMLKFSRVAKKGVGPKIRKHGFWGLLIFVMIPVPGTGAYMGTIAAVIFKIDRREAFRAITLGVFFSCVIVLALMQAGSLGFSFFKN
jgi:uncharacterized membrane protein